LGSAVCIPSLKNDINNSADVVFNKWFARCSSEIFKANPRMKRSLKNIRRKAYWKVIWKKSRTETFY
jgi:hypothetical protein